MESHDQGTGRLFLLLKAAGAAMRSALLDALSDIGITPPQLLVIRALELTPAISSAELSRQCFVSPQAMVSTLTRLEQAGLVERTKGGGRIIETHLTEKGHATLVRAGERITAAQNYIRSVMGTERVDQLTELLEELTDVLLKSQIVTTSRSWDLDE